MKRQKVKCHYCGQIHQLVDEEYGPFFYCHMLGLVPLVDSDEVLEDGRV